MSDEPQTMSMQFPVLCWDCEVKLTDGDVRERVEMHIEQTGTVGEPAVRVSRVTRLVCEFCSGFRTEPERAPWTDPPAKRMP